MALLERAKGEERIAHAYLFTGPEGVGKKLAALHVATLLNCPGPRHEAAAPCSVCRRILTGKHPDVWVESPLRGVIRVERVREIQETLQLTTVESPYKVCIFDDAHTLTRGAQNALLKTLEEPPPQRVLILVSAKPSFLLPTVRSRCRRIRFGPLPLNVVIKILAEQGIVPPVSEVLGRASGGSVSRAMVMHRQNFIALRNTVIDLVSAPTASGFTGILQKAQEWSKDRQIASEVLGVIASWFRDLLLASLGLVGENLVINSDFLDSIKAQAQDYATDQVLAAYDEVIRAGELVQAEFNPNLNLILDVTLLRIARILSSVKTVPDFT